MIGDRTGNTIFSFKTSFVGIFLKKLEDGYASRARTSRERENVIKRKVNIANRACLTLFHGGKKL